VETALLYLVLYVASTGFAEIAEHFGEDPLEGVAPHGSTRFFVGIGDGFEAVVADVDGGTEAVAALLGCVTVVASQLLHIFLGAQHGAYDYLVEGDALDGQ
jgi:hypothetical protein